MKKKPERSDFVQSQLCRIRHNCDNGRVYISNHFLLLVTDLEIKKIHHPAYAAWCKGKIEAIMKLLKKFQSEAVLADFKTIEELNSTLSSWLDVEYDNKIHSSTGEPPNNRWRNNLYGT